MLRDNVGWVSSHEDSGQVTVNLGDLIIVNSFMNLINHRYYCVVLINLLLTIKLCLYILNFYITDLDFIIACN